MTHEEILRGKASERLNECAFEVASRAHQHLTKARSLSEKVPAAAKQILLPAITVDDYLQRLQKIGYDVHHPSLKHKSWNWAPKLWWFAIVRNKY